MGLTVFPTILVDNSTGSDTGTSGAGPSTAIVGTGCAVTNGSASVTISDAVSLGGVATDGSAVLRVLTASGRQFTRISAISGSSGAWTLTVEDTVWTAGTGKTWAIGGKLATLDATAARQVMTADAKVGWTVSPAYTGTDYALTSNVSCITNFAIVGTGATRPRLDGQFNGTMFQPASASGGSAAVGSLAFRHLQFISTAGTKTSQRAIGGDATGGSSNNLLVSDCLLGSWTSGERLTVGASNVNSSGSYVAIEATGVINTTSSGISFLRDILVLVDSYLDTCGASGTPAMNYGAFAFSLAIEIRGCLFVNSPDVGASIATLEDSRLVFMHSTFANNTSHGLYIDPQGRSNGPIAYAKSNDFSNNGGYGIGDGGSIVSSQVQLCSNNNFYHNTINPTNNFPQGTGALALNPTYASPAGHDFTPGTPIRGQATPSTYPGSSTLNYRDLGGSQHQDSGGGGTTATTPAAPLQSSGWSYVG